MTRKTWFGLLLVVGFVLLKFYPFFLQQKYPIPFDILAGGYWPWRLVDYGYPAGVPIKNPIVSDVVSQLFVWNDLSWNLVKQGLTPLWDRYSLLGYPYYANYHSAIFFPLNIIGLFFNSSTARTIVLLCTQLLAAVGMYGYIVHRNKNHWTAVLAAMIFVSAGFMTTDFLFASGSRAISFLPYIFWMTDLYIKRNRLRYLKLLSVSWMMLFLSGHFQMTVYSTAMWSIYVLLAKTETVKKIKLIVFWMLGLTASFVQLIPTIELLRLSFRNAESYISQVNFGILPAKHLITTFFAPDFWGNNATGNYFGFWNYRESVSYLGLIPTFFAILGIVRRPKGFFAITFFISLVFVFVPQLALLVYKFHLPLISGSAASRLLFITVFAGSILVADGFELFLKKKVDLILLLFFSIFLGICVWVGVEKYVYSSSGLDLTTETYFRNNMINIRNIVLPILNMISLVFCAFIIRIYRNKASLLVTIFLLLLIGGDLMRFHFKWNTFNETKIAPHKYSLNGKIDSNKRLASTSDEIFPPNSATLIRTPSVLGYDPLFPLDNGIFLNAINGEYNPDKVNRYFNNVSNTKSLLLDYSSVGYLATLTRDKAGILSEKGLVPYYIDTDKWVTSYREKEMVILQNKEALPLFYFANNLVNLEKEKQIQSMVTDKKLTTYIDGKVGPFVKDESDLISYSVMENGEAIVKTKNNSDQYLVYNQALYPGWEAFVDGIPTKIYPTNYLFGGIVVPKGEHNVAWKFRPKSFYFGAFMSILSLLVISLYRDEQKIGRVS